MKLTNHSHSIFQKSSYDWQVYNIDVIISTKIEPFKRKVSKRTESGHLMFSNSSG